MDGVGFLKQIFTLYLIPPNSAEIEGNFICQDTNPAVIELEAVFKGQLGYWWQKSALTNCFISDHIDFIIIKTDCASFQTAEVLVFLLLAFFFFNFQLYNSNKNSFSLSSHISLISEVNRCYYSLLELPSQVLRSYQLWQFQVAIQSNFLPQPLGKAFWFSRQRHEEAAWMFMHYFAPQPSRQAVWSQTATTSSPGAICSFDSSFCGAVPTAGEITGLRAHCSLGSAPYPGAAQRDDADPLSLALCHQDIPTQGTLNWQLKLPWNWAALDRDSSLIVRICIESDPLRLWGSSFVSSAMQFLTKLPWHCASKQQPSN